MRLIIQTNIPGQIGIWVAEPGGRIRARAIRRVQYHGSERLLALVHSVLQAHHLQPTRLSQIVVVRGPGSFTAVRTGLVVANTLGWLWDIPVLGIVREGLLQPDDIEKLIRPEIPQSQELVRPWYGREPNITLPKRSSWV